ncbi:MAG TPA: hypothetical protein PKH33_10260 [bacterium]|nr:hypothetical protein [bacterium]
MAIKWDPNFLIDTPELMKLVGIKKIAKLRIYVSKYKIYVPAARDPEDGKKYLFERRCAKIRKRLLDSCFVPGSGITLVEIGKRINQICGKKDEILYKDLKNIDDLDKLGEMKEKELEELNRNKPKDQ